ncbi:MAG: hypothetical protein NZ937_01670 [Armatimonadetes bacterium]|nr:hypothetical protein [Armatimonadota bacterium]
MKRVWIVALVLFSTAVAKLTSNQSVNPYQWNISFEKHFGGLLSLLQIQHLDSPKVIGMRIYTDWGILRPGRYEPVGSQNEQSPKIIQKVSGNEKILAVEGQLKNKQGQPCGLRYQVEHRFGFNELTMKISLIAEHTFNFMHGFLAMAMNFSGANEWFACTQKGWLFANIANDGRVFQSTQNPLMDDRKIIGVANSKTGWAIVFKLLDFTPEDSVENVLIHASPQGSGGIFIAWCDGASAKAMKTGETWQVSLKLKFLRIEELISSEW